jgi:hypothetical protein
MNQSGIRDNHFRGSVGEFLREKIQPGSRLAVPAAFVEELIDACVLELYFSEEAAAKNLCFIDQIAALVGPMPPSGAPGVGTQPTVSDIETFVSIANAPSHPIRTRLDHLTAASPDLFAVIQQEGKV